MVTFTAHVPFMFAAVCCFTWKSDVVLLYLLGDTPARMDYCYPGEAGPVLDHKRLISAFRREQPVANELLAHQNPLPLSDEGSEGEEVPQQSSDGSAPKELPEQEAKLNGYTHNEPIKVHIQAQNMRQRS